MGTQAALFKMLRSGTESAVVISAVVEATLGLWERAVRRARS
jgi:hypothetical protein